MPLPELIPIVREAGYRTDTIGGNRGGQFFAAIRRLGRDYDDEHPGRMTRDLAWYAYLHCSIMTARISDPTSGQSAPAFP